MKTSEANFIVLVGIVLFMASGFLFSYSDALGVSFTSLTLGIACIIYGLVQKHLL